ncbi:MAG: NmrA family NAD(P)-binding protein [Syntrophobacteraceae bacterium]|nr:NmrA family NAD(P)-binding protein [Syntrophobacteraceae bacterium]
MAAEAGCIRSVAFCCISKPWTRKYDELNHFLREGSTGKLALLELGVGSNAAAIIRYPFKSANEHGTGGISVVQEHGQRIAVIGATGQVGMSLSKELKKLGHKVLAISRGVSTKNRDQLDILESLGIQLYFQRDLKDVARLACALSGQDVVVVALRANVRLVLELEPPILKAAVSAKVRRFVPDEFGTHTKALDYGVGTLFDAKKNFQEQVYGSGLEWTMIFPGGIFDYFLPNLRLFDKITTFGDLRCMFPTHSIKDIGAISARAITDPRTANKAVQLYANVVNQEQLVRELKLFWPDYPFDFEYVSSETIIHLKNHGDPDRISAKGGAEPDRERHGINYANYVLCRLASLDDPDTLNANDLYPDHVYQKPEQALADPKFVFEKTQ